MKKHSDFLSVVGVFLLPIVLLVGPVLFTNAYRSLTDDAPSIEQRVEQVVGVAIDSCVVLQQEEVTTRYRCNLISPCCYLVVSERYGHLFFEKKVRDDSRLAPV